MRYQCTSHVKILLDIVVTSISSLKNKSIRPPVVRGPSFEAPFVFYTHQEKWPVAFIPTSFVVNLTYLDGL